MQDGTEEPAFAVGMLEVQPNLVTVLADTAIGAMGLGEANVLEAKRKAEEALQKKTSRLWRHSDPVASCCLRWHNDIQTLRNHKDRRSYEGHVVIGSKRPEANEQAGSSFSAAKLKPKARK